ncbi:meiotic recombination directing protein [Martiniozyma asiatica (nom. inval.)]|nr:meiotic recombination directing protein [Martiniozyma asiatica]
MIWALSALLPLLPLLIWWISSRPRKELRPEKFELPFPPESQPNWKGRRLSPLSIYQKEDPANIYCYCPATGQFLGKFPAHTSSQIDNFISQARVAQRSFYSDDKFQMKKHKFLATLSTFILKNQAAIARVACRDSGKTMVDASMGEIMVTLEKINWIIKHGDAALRTSSRPGPSNILMKYKKAEVWYEPLGVVSAVVSWNYPFHNMLGPIISSVFAGNAVVIKCSERVRWSSEFFLQIVRSALKVCNIPEDLVQLVCCWPDEADSISGNPGLDHLTFIGSQAVAKKVVSKASEVLMPVVVELGGKDAVIICDDYLKAKGVDGIASVLMRGTFQSSGQNCIGIERIIICGDDENYNQLVEKLKERVSQLRLGSDIDQSEGIDVGAMIMDLNYDKLENSITDMVESKQARLLCGGKRFIHPNYPSGHYFTPTLLADVDPKSTLAQNEVFGPVMMLIHAKDNEEGISIANSTSYGLGGSIYTTNRKRGFEYASKLRTGNVAINDFATFYVCQLPFGGVKGSGYGKFGGEEGLRGVCVEKSVCYDRLSCMSTSIPPVIDYPVGERAWSFVEAMLWVGYGGLRGWRWIGKLIDGMKP